MLAAISYYQGKQTAPVAFAVVHESRLAIHILLINGDRIVQQGLLCFVPTDPMGANLTEIIPISFKHPSLSLYMQYIYLCDNWHREFTRI
jgi:hypothetical protein